jgi:hypothetical protein
MRTRNSMHSEMPYMSKTYSSSAADMNSVATARRAAQSLHRGPTGISIGLDSEADFRL